MSKVYILFLLVAFLIYISCGEDRTHEYEELTERDHWMTDIMKEKYLWGDSINEEKIQWKSYFTEPVTFFKTLTAFAPFSDSWSWCSIDTLCIDYHERGFFNHLDSYGMDFMLMTDPTGATSRQFARVITVIPGSPADRCGIERGDFIGMVDDNKMSSSYTSYIKSGKSRKLVVSHLDVNTETEELIWSSVDTVQMEKSEYVEDVPYPVCKMFEAGPSYAAYLMCNRLTSGPVEKEADSQTYSSQLENIISAVRTYSPENVIVDLRLCNFGQLEMANKLASYLLSPSFNGQAFATTFYNASRFSENDVCYFDSHALQNGLSPENVFFITSAYTKGAAEWLIRAIQHALGEANVFTIGVKTAGQYVMTEDIPSQYSATLHPAVAFVGNADGDYNYNNGISPDYEINEFTYVKLYPYGNENETVLSFVLSEINHLY